MFSKYRKKTGFCFCFFFLEILEKLIKVSFSVMATLTLLGKLDAINVGRKGDWLCFVLCEL